MKIKTKLYLSILIIAALLIPTAVAYAASHFRLRADAGWVDSGIDLEAGQQITITAHGRSITAPVSVFDSSTVSGPDGQINICPNFDDPPPCAMDFAPYGALVGRIGVNGEPFYLGSSLTFTPTESGDL